MSEMTASLGSRFQATYAVEDSWGVLPSSYDVYNLRVTDFGVNLNRDTFESDEIRNDRQNADLRHGMNDISGDVGAELSYGAFDDIIASAMFNEWATDDTIVIGTTQKSLRLQKGLTDIGKYHEFTGCVVGSWSLTVEPNAIVTTTFSFTGERMETTQTLTGAINKATNAPFDSFSGYLYEGPAGSSLASSDEIATVTGIDFSLENNLEALQVIGKRNAQGIAEGRAALTGTLSAHFTSDVLLDKFINETEAAIEFKLTDGSSNSYTFYIPRLKYTGSTLDVGGEGPLSLSMPFTALVPTTAPNSILQITR